MDVTQLVGEIADYISKGGMVTCEHLLLNPEKENGRHIIFSFAMNIVDAHNLSPKLDKLIEKFMCAANMNVAFGFLLKNVGPAGITLHTKTTHWWRDQNLWRPKKIRSKIKKVLSNTDVMEVCT